LNTPTQTQILERAVVHLQNGWVQGVSARDSAGNLVSELSPEAVVYCAMGAVTRAFVAVFRRGPACEELNAIVEPVARELYAYHPRGAVAAVVSCNDRTGTKQSDVVGAFQAAIRKLKEREAGAERFVWPVDTYSLLRKELVA